MKNCKKLFIHGLLAGLVMLIVGMIFGQLVNMMFPTLAVQYDNTNLFRAFDDPAMIWYFIYFFVLGVGIAWIWEMIKDKIKGKTACQKAKNIVSKYWPAVLLPGMMITYSSFPVSFGIILSWSIGSFVQLYAGFWFLAKKNK